KGSDSSLCRVIAERVSSQLGETVRGGSPGAGSRGIDRSTCSVRHQSSGRDSLYSECTPPVLLDPSAPKLIPGPTIGQVLQHAKHMPRLERDDQNKNQEISCDSARVRGSETVKCRET